MFGHENGELRGFRLIIGHGTARGKQVRGLRQGTRWPPVARDKVTCNGCGDFSSKGWGVRGFSLGSETLCGHTPRQVCVSLRLTRAAFAQARKTVQGGCNCGTL